MKKILLLFVMLCAMCTQVSAQAIKGDMNGDCILDVTDINEMISTILDKIPKAYVSNSDHAKVNVLVSGTWYDTPAKKFVLNANGTTDYPEAVTFRYIPTYQCILFFDKQGNISTVFKVVSLQDGMMVVIPFGTEEQIRLTSEPVQLVTSITLAPSALHMAPGEKRTITATVLPEDASNKKVTWSVSNPAVARVTNNVVEAVANGEAVVTCSATDGSGVVATCKVVVGTRHEYVDLGLPSGVLWATCNIGAEKPEDISMYFAWGDIKGYAKGENHWFIWDYYKWCRGSKTIITRYCTNSGYGEVDYIYELLAEDDAATVIWGKDWRMPTSQDISDLCNSEYTTSEWVTVNGVKGRMITSRINGNSIFMPAGGRRFDSETGFVGENGNYWSSSVVGSMPCAADLLDFSAARMTRGTGDRCRGLTIRPVRAVKTE